MPDREEQLVNVTETAKRLSVHPNTVRNWAKEGILPSARVPGSRFHRFRLDDVERLARERGRASTLEQDRRSIGPELVGASQLHEWSGTREAQGLFPELLRRLLAATPGITGLSMRSGDSIGTAGWDGRAQARGVSWLPEGELRFELGTSQDSKRKADEDFEKRVRETDASQVIFVFVTSRRWKAAETWADQRRAQGAFADVRAIDADTLEGPLVEHPAVHYWISERLGRTPADVQTLERWWERLSARTSPPLPTRLFLAGRQEQAEKLAAFLAGPPGVLAIQSGWREEAVAFVRAALQQSEDDPLALVVSTPQAWGRALSESSGACLIPLFDDADTRGVQDGRLHVILPLGREERAAAGTLTLPAPERMAAAEALRAADFPFNESDELAALARRSMPALIRRKARDTRIARPAWAQPRNVATIAPLALIGRWRTSDADTAVVSRLVKEDWESIERRLLQWRDSDDPPFVRSAEVWHLASPDDAFLFLSPQLTPAELERWHDIIVDVLLEHDPLTNLSAEEQTTAGLRGIRLQHSRELRAGLADAVALAGALEEAPLGDATGEEHATRAVHALLRAANADQTGGVWASLADVLPRLAEGAPHQFLEMVHADLHRDEPVLRLMFKDRERESWFVGSSPHTGLLWALETLAWSSEHLLETCRALARLAEVDPGGRLANRPPRSLQAILVGWIRQTGTSLEQKLTAIRTICRDHPDVGWELILSLWPQSHAVISPPSQPVHRAWAPEKRGVAPADWLRFIDCVVEVAIGLADADAARWATLSERLGPLPRRQRERFTEALADLARDGGLDAQQRLVVWERLRQEIARHRRFPDADWSMSGQTLARLEEIAELLKPSSRAESNSYLFDWHPDVPGVDVLDHARYEPALEALREQAVRDVIEREGIEGLRTLALRSAAPHQLGWQLPKTAPPELEGELLAWLDADEQNLRVVASQWTNISLRQDGERWLTRALEQIPADRGERRTMLVLSMPPDRVLWDALARLDPELADIYWRRANILLVDPGDIEHAVRQLLSRNRPWTALDVVAGPLQGGEPRPEAIRPALVYDVLDAALAAPPGESPSQVPGYELGLLLDYLEEHDADPQRVARYEYAFFRLLEDIRRPRALYAALAADPAMFVELGCCVYRANSEPRRELTERDADLATHAWWILEHWRELPGRGEGTDVDADHLHAWVSAAREAFAQADRGEIGDELVGRLLATSPDGKDGLWPAEPVRGLIETLESPHIEAGIHTGVINGRGFTSRGVFDGGQQERELAERYERLSRETAAGWSRTSRLLRQLAKSYRQDARREDAEAAVRANS